MRKYYYYFERYAGRPLLKWERRVIAALEYYRQHKTLCRVLIIDPPGYDSRELLCQYLRFVHDRLNPNIAAAVIGRTRKSALKSAAYAPRHDSSWLYIGTGMKPDSLRGRTFDYALLLDADGYSPANRSRERFIQTARSNFCRILRTISPVIPQTGNNFIIIHTRGHDPGCPSIYVENPQVAQPSAMPPQSAKGNAANEEPGPRIYLLNPDAPPEEIADNLRLRLGAVRPRR